MKNATYLPPYRPARWYSPGMTPLQEKVFNWIAGALVLLIMTGWAIAIGQARAERIETGPRAVAEPVVARGISSALLDPRSTSTAFINDAMLAFVNPLRGESGKLKAAFRQPGEALSEDENIDGHAVAQYSGPAGEQVVSPDFTAPERPGIYKLAVQIDQARRAIADLSVVTLVPFSEKHDGRIGLYYLGSWPYERGGTPRTPAYANPSGFIEVTAQNRNTYVSEHFRLGDFLTKGQNDVWPKYLLLNPDLLDKLELVIEELQAEGVRVDHVQIMSGFRTPIYNKTGGDVTGRANLSRHMYGDAADIFVDNDRNGIMDDLNHDGRVDIRDSEVIRRAADAVERMHPALVGGVGVYPACCGHGPFTHIDVRGFRARWQGTGNG